MSGGENINDVYHCQTRLRFKLADEGKAEQEKLEALDGVSKVMIAGGVYQVIIGTHVKYVFEEIEKIVGPKKEKKEDNGKKEKKSIPGVIVDFIAGSLQPIIPALSGAGMVKALLAVLVAFELVNPDTSQTYYILNFFADAVFYYLPILIAFTEAQKLNCNPVLAAAVAGIMLHPSWGTLMTEGSSVVLFGLHNGVAPLGVMQMADLGYDSIFGPGCVCSNIAQGTASLIVAWRTREKKMRQIAVSGGITALMGITEPTLYGVTLPKRYPLIAAMIGGACGGLYAGLTQTHRFATGSSGLPAVVLYIGDNTMRCFYNIIIALIITAAVTAVLTYVLSLKFEKAPAVQETADTADRPAGEPGAVMAPLSGNVIELKEVGDGVFSEGILGDGCGIEPEEGCVYAPFNGEVIQAADTGHAVGLLSEDGVELLIHVGLDTVALKGEGFDLFVKEGDRVTQGQKLLNFDIEKIAQKYPVVTSVIVTNTPDYKEIRLVKTGKTKAGEKILQTEGGN